MLVDFHAHILPKVDHGSDSLEVSRRQLLLAKKYGIDSIVATSHFYPHSRSAKSFVERRNAAFRELVPQAEALGINLMLGAEALLCHSFDKIPYVDDLCISGTRIILLELPFADFQIDYCQSIYNLVSSGYKVVMAHAERYDSSWIAETLEAGAKLQLNAPSLSLFKVKRVLPWLERGEVIALGSDIHGASAKAYRAFSSASKKAEKRYPDVVAFSDELRALAFKK